MNVTFMDENKEKSSRIFRLRTHQYVNISIYLYKRYLLESQELELELLASLFMVTLYE